MVRVSARRGTGHGLGHPHPSRGNYPWYVMADPEGNEFCIVRPDG
jgi:hypothetical protein